MRLRLSFLIASVVAVAAVPATAEADPSWGPVGTVVPGGRFVTATPALALPADGSGYVSYATQSSYSRPPVMRLARRPRGHPGFARAQVVRGMVAGPAPLSADGTSRVLLVGLDRTLQQAAGDTPAHLYATFVGAGSGKRRAAVATVRHLSDGPVLMTAPGGQAAIAWTERRGDTDQLRVATKVAGARRFGRVQVVSGRGRASAPALAYDRSGHLVVAFQRTTGLRRPLRRVVVRVRGAHGFGVPRTVGSSAGIARISLAAGKGRIAVAYDTFDVGEEVNTTTTVHVGTASYPGSFRTRTVDPGGAHRAPASAPSVGIDDRGDAVAVWNGVRHSGGSPVLAASVSPDGTVSAPQTLSADGDRAKVAMSSRGTAYAVWAQGGASEIDPAHQIFAATRPEAAAAFGAPAAISPAETAEAPSVALDPRTELPTIAWIARPGVTSIAHETSRPAVVRIASLLG